MSQAAPVGELVNTLEVGVEAWRILGNTAFATIADVSGSERAALDRLTLRPRLMVNTLGLDLTTDFAGLKMFAPIVAGPAEMQQRFHPDGEIAAARGASAAKAAIVISERSSVPLAKIAPEAVAAGFWFQVYTGGDAAASRSKIDEAVKSGAKAVCLTSLGSLDWATVDQLRKGLTVPFMLKGIMSPADARTAADRGLQAIVLSAYRGAGATGLAASIEMLPAIAEASAGRVPILIDGGFRRGGDILKALALGARAVMVTRPVLWGLAAYGAPGVQHVLETLQTELGRAMAMCGKPNLASIDRTLVRLHRR